MASKEGEEENCGCNTYTEEETIALQKKRSRRVSFAETTAIHLFIREEDYETPPDSANASSKELVRSESEEIMELLQSSEESDNDGINGDDDDVALKGSFIRPMGSPSPGSTFGSATSNDEENFFGPVSTDFIKPRRLSDSAASDENHDVTMDSTAFSMHFRSLARSDSGGEFKTPTGTRLAFDERTHGQISTATGTGDSMVLTTARKPISRPALPADKVTDSGHSDDMSLVSENPHRYDYGKLPPELDVLLAEGGKDVGAVSLTSNVECSNSISSLRKDTISALDHNRDELLDLRDNQDADAYMKKASGEACPAADTNIDRGNDSFAAATLGEGTHNNMYSVDNDSVTVTMTPSKDQIEAPILQKNGMPFDKDEDSRTDATGARGKFESPPSSTQLNLDSEQPTKPSFAGSVSSFLAKHRHIFKISANSSNEKSTTIPLANELCDKESIKHVSSGSYFRKSASRLKQLEAFPFASTSKAECNASRLISPGCSTRSKAKTNLSRYRSKDISKNHVDVPVACLEAHFSNVAEKDGEIKSLTNVGSNGLRSTEDIKLSNSIEEVKVGLRSLSYASPSHDKSTNITCAPASADSQKKGLEYPVSTDNHAKGTLQPMLSNFSLAEITFNDMKYNSMTGLHNESVFPPKNGSEKKVSAYEGTLSLNVNKKNQSHTRLNQDVTQNKANNLASRTENSSSLLYERKAETNMPSSDIVRSKDVSQESQMQNQESMNRNQYHSPATSTLFQTALKDKASESCDSLSGDGQTGRALTRSTANLDRSNELPIQVLESPVGKLACSQLREKQSDLADDVNVYLFNGKDVTTPGSSWLTSNCDDNDELLEKPCQVCGSNSSFGLKRKYGRLFDKAEEQNDEITSFQHISKLCKGQNNHAEGSQVFHKTGGDTTLRHWDHVFTSFCGAIQQLLSPWIDKLDFALIGVVNDVLFHLMKKKSYELLHHDICFQKAFEYSCFLRNKRIMDTKLLLYTTVYEKAKLQLMHRKRDKLLDQVQQLNARVQESAMLISRCRLHDEKDLRLDCFKSESCRTGSEDISLVPDGISLLRKELELSERKIKNLTESFCSYFKGMEHQTCSTTEVAKDFLKKRVSCRSLQSELQLCEVESLETVNSQQNFRFDHLGFMSQRFIVNSNSTRGVLISNKLNNLKISKMFLSMDACTAFSFVLSGDTVLTYAGLKTIAQQTQKTNSLLHNLLDVVEEVELAMTEFRHLTRSKFCQPSAGKLDLQFCFCDFKSGARVILSIDVSCLNRGVYPSPVLPYEVQGRAAGKHESFQLLLSNIREAVRGLSCGYMRILSLCRCVSKMIQASDGMN